MTKPSVRLALRLLVAVIPVAWVLHNRAVTGAIVGARKPGQIEGVLGASGLRLSVSEVAEFEAFFAKAAA